MSFAKVNAAAVKMRELFTDEKHWTQRANARTDKGEDVDPYHSSATCWCLTGAAAKVSNSMITNQGLSAMMASVLRQHYPCSVWQFSSDVIVIAAWNDNASRTIDEVRGLVDTVIQRTQP